MSLHRDLRLCKRPPVVRRRGLACREETALPHLKRGAIYLCKRPLLIAVVYLVWSRRRRLTSSNCARDFRPGLTCREQTSSLGVV